jgi:hypothetical protein
MSSFGFRYLFSLAIIFGLCGLWGSVSLADGSSDFKFDFHGIAGASMYIQSNPDFVLNGQGPLILKSENPGTTTGFDVRQTRLSFSVTGPTVLGNATPKAVVEADFFGLDSPGGYGEVNALQRLRLAYAELSWGDTWVRAGQDWELLWVDAPITLGHLAFSPAWSAGLIGWREPGFSVYHKISTGDGSNVEGAFQIIKSDWASPLAFGDSSSNDQNVDAGQLSGLPGVEARVKWMNEHVLAYIAGHWNRVDGANAADLVYSKSGDSLSLPDRKWDVVAGKVGGKFTYSDITLQGEFYVGKNTAPLFGEQTTFYSANDVHEAGGWIQAGYGFTSELSLWGLFGTTRSNKDDVIAAKGGPYANTVAGGMLQYKVGGFGVGPEIYHVETKSTLAAGTGAPDGVMDGMQYMLSAMYFF